MIATLREIDGPKRAYWTPIYKDDGRPVLAWIAERRMAEARRRPLETEDDLAAITEAVSDTDLPCSIPLFRRAHGMTPARWRGANRSGT